jgi:DNA-binding IclR family transcriptional regulator
MGRSRTIELLRNGDDLPSNDRQSGALAERDLRVLRVPLSAHATLSNGEFAPSAALSNADLSRLTHMLSGLEYLAHNPLSRVYLLALAAPALGMKSLMQSLADDARATAST